MTQKELAPRLGIDPTTLNNFLNSQTQALGGISVALACTFLDLDCNGTKIGRIARGAQPPTPTAEQLILEFDSSFEVMRASSTPTVALRKSSTRQSVLRLAIKRVG